MGSAKYLAKFSLWSWHWTFVGSKNNKDSIIFIWTDFPSFVTKVSKHLQQINNHQNNFKVVWSMKQHMQEHVGWQQWLAIRKSLFYNGSSSTRKQDWSFFFLLFYLIFSISYSFFLSLFIILKSIFFQINCIESEVKKWIEFG